MDMHHSISNYMEHGYCFSWEKDLVSLHVTSDIVTGLSYYAIAVALFYFVYKRRDVPFFSVFFLFGAFILACGTTHLFAAYTVFVPEYWMEGGVKALTAVVSVISVVVAIPSLRDAVSFPSLTRSLQENKSLNEQLKSKVDELNARTQQLMEANRGLQLSESRYRVLVEHAPEAIVVVDADLDRVVDVNANAERLFGCSRRDLVERGLQRIFGTGQPGDSSGAGSLREHVERALRGEAPPFEQAIRGPEGAEVLCEIRVVRLPSAEQNLVRASFIDVTERGRAEEALRKSESMLSLVLNSVPQHVFWKDRESVYLGCNEPFARAAGLSHRAEIVGKTDFDLPWQRGEAEAYRADDREVIERNRPKAHIIETQRQADGRLLWLDTTKVPLTDRSGRPVGVLGVYEDITDRKQAEEERSRLESQLRQAQKMEAVGTLAGGIAHDFNNILTPIIAHSELALLGMPDASPAREDIAGILSAAERAKDLVRQILAISRKEDEGAAVPVNLGALVKETAKFLRASIPATIGITIDVDPACGPVLAEPARLHQVILNLCTNASFAMAERGGGLTVSVAREGETSAGGGEGSVGRGRVRLVVSDTGPGIPPEVRARIFEPYFTTKPVGKGSGLGLAVVHGIVTSLGGEIRVHSEPGKGATFEVLLPETELPADRKRTLFPQVPKGAGQRVLAVDDEPSIRSVLERMLTTLGYEATVCGSGAEALEVFRADPRRFDVVLTDYTMQGMTGMALAAELRALRPELPIILGTGFSEGAEDRVVAGAGLRGPVMKPYSAKSLGEVLRSALAEDRGA